MYVGQAASLKRRFGEYLNAERLETGRPKIFRLLNIYDRHVWFGFTSVPRERLNQVEDDLISAHLPPCNDKLPTKIAKAAKAF
jgi:excinuclease UvrABC nuclease subunit